MVYHARLLESKFRRYAAAFPCVALIGARQVGKSTLLRHLFAKRTPLFTFDPVQDLYGERTDPALFLRNHPPPLLLDEIQFVPGLVAALKRVVDEQRRPGLFIITGSQQWAVMRHLSESLAGRVALLEMAGFTLGEARRSPEMAWLSTWLTRAARQPAKAEAWLQRARSAGLSPAQCIWRGSFPEVFTLEEDLVNGWMAGYVATYLQRDVRGLLGVRDETHFANFLALCAALSAQEINSSQLGRDIGITTPSAQSWLGVLRGTLQWLEIPAFARNQVQRLSRKPKGYLTDTGLACHLLRISSPAALSGHPAFGALFETFVVLELWKQAQAMPHIPAFHHYRLHSGSEVDLVLELDGQFYPIEIKAASNVKPADARGITEFQARMGQAAGTGLIIHPGERAERLGPHCLAVPFDAIIA